MEDRIGKWIKVNWKGTQRLALVKACRVDPESPKPESLIYYCHFHGTDSRLDSWIPASDVLCEANEPPLPQSNGSVADSPAWSDALSKKRKRDAEMPAAGYSSASNPTTALQPRTISTVYFGDYRIKAWYHSPYPIEDLLREMPLNKPKAATPAPSQPAAPAAASGSSASTGAKMDKQKGILKNAEQPVAAAQPRTQRPQRRAAANAMAQSEQAQGRTRTSKRLSAARSSLEPPAAPVQNVPASYSAVSSQLGTPTSQSPEKDATALGPSKSTYGSMTMKRDASIQDVALTAVPQQAITRDEVPTHSPLRLKGGGKRRRHKSSSPTPPRLTPPPDRSDWSFVNPNNGRLMKPFNPFGDTTSESSSETEEEDFKPGDSSGNGSTSAPAPQAQGSSQARSDSGRILQAQAPEQAKASTSTTPDPQAIQSSKQAVVGQAEIAATLSAKKKQESMITNATLYVCEACFKYFVHDTTYVQHKATCKYKEPPGDEIYNSTVHSMWEVDGAKAKLYCQNLCLFGKLFIDHKYVFFDTSPFLFYIMTERRPGFNHVLGFFSKEKVSYNDYNLACIVTIPPYQKNGFGRFMIEFSYELSAQQANSRRAGTPERPLSDLGLRTYLQFWTAVLVRWFRLIFFTQKDPRLAATFTNTKEDRSLKAAAKAQLKATPSTGSTDLSSLNGLPLKSNAAPGKDSKAKQFQTRFSVAEIANAVNLREDDVAFALIHSGLAKYRAPAPTLSAEVVEDTIRVENAVDDDLELVIAPGLVDDVAKRFKVSDPFIRYNGFKKSSVKQQEQVVAKKSAETAVQQK